MDSKSKAVITYLWGDESPYPRADPAAVVEIFGTSEGPLLVEYVEAVLADGREVPIDWSCHTLDSMSHVYAAAISERHPELSDDAIESLRVAFTYWYK